MMQRLNTVGLLECVWPNQVIDGRGYFFDMRTYGVWPTMVVISEIVQTFILADFCYYYVQRCLPLLL